MADDGDEGRIGIRRRPEHGFELAGRPREEKTAMKDFSHGDCVAPATQREKRRAASQNIVASGGGVVKLVHLHACGGSTEVLED